MLLKKSTVQHLRFPFSLFLLPVYLFGLSQAGEVSVLRAVLTFSILHFLVYPASNGYNSYYDKDEGSIGGVEKPLPVSKELWYVSLCMDVIAIGLGFVLGLEFVLLILLYGLASKAYSNPKIRLKKYAVLGWLTVFIFQGFVTYVMVLSGLKGNIAAEITSVKVWLPAVLSSVLLGGAYPMTQIYQHGEDKRRGDITISIKLGIRGTFYFTAFWFLLANAGFYVLLTFNQFIVFQGFMVFVLIYFLYWFRLVYKDEQMADFKHTMRLNMLSSASMNLFFLTLWLWNLNTHYQNIICLLI
jgi:1,4-dihydroxy-2-naphthoate octaprenyltransferase